MISEKKVLCVIPARGGSVGIKDKNLMLVHNTSLVGWAAKVGRSVLSIDNLVVSTDSEKIANSAVEFGAEFLGLRPPELSGSSIHDQQVLIDALEKAESHFGYEFEVIVMLQPTSPLRTLEEVQECIASVKEKDKSACWTVSRIDVKNHYRKQLEVNLFGDMKLAVQSERVVSRQELNETYIRNGACYAFSKDTLYTDPNLLGPNCGHIVSDGIRPNIDTIEDLDYARAISKVHLHNGFLIER